MLPGRYRTERLRGAVALDALMWIDALQGYISSLVQQRFHSEQAELRVREMGARLCVFKVQGGYEQSFLNSLPNWDDWLVKT